MELIGMLKEKFDAKIVSDRFKKRDFVLTTESTTPYPQHVLIQLTQDKCGILDKYQIGEELKVQVNIRGKEWNGGEGTKYFVTIEAWGIESLSETTTPTPTLTSNTNDLDPLPF